MKIPKTPDITAYQEQMQLLADKCYGYNDRTIAMFVKSIHRVNDNLVSLREKRDALNEDIAKCKAKESYARYLITELMRGNDLSEAGEGIFTVKRMKASKPTVMPINDEAAYMVPAEYAKVTYTLDKVKILSYIKEHDYKVPSDISDAVRLVWVDKLKFAGEK